MKGIITEGVKENEILCLITSEFLWQLDQKRKRIDVKSGISMNTISSRMKQKCLYWIYRSIT